MVLKDDPKAYAIMGCAMRVHSILGYGFLESAYGDALEIEFKKSGIPYVREDNVRIYYDGQPLPTNWRADFTCFDRGYIDERNAHRPVIDADDLLRRRLLQRSCSCNGRDRGNQAKRQEPLP